MRYVTVNVSDVTINPRDIDGRKFSEIYGQELAPIIYDYTKTSDLIVFDKNKELIKQKYKENSKSSKPFFNRLKTIIYLTDVYLKRQTFDTVWDIPLIIRKLSRSNLCYIEHGHDQLHILKYCNVREFEFIELSNIEFSEDFKPKLKTLFPVDTDFEFKYDDDNKKYSFTTKHKIQKSPNFNLERFLNSDYIKDHPSALIVQPNRVSLRDAAILSIRKKG